MTFTPATAALLVRDNGGTDEEAIFLASVMPGESGGDPDVVNTHASCGQANGLILHAVGLFQICDYPSRGTRAQLRNPDHNAREALKILRSQSRAAWTATPDPDAADEARRALAGGPPVPQVISRDEWGARPPASAPTRIDPRGPAIHWEGPQMGIHDPSEYAGIVRGFQSFHMDGNGWADIAYNALVSPHGQVFAGRGPNVRSAANGSNDGNAGWVAICYIAGENDPFTEEAKSGIVAAAEWLGVANGEWKVHRDFVATACPGDEITAWVRAGHPASHTPDQEDPFMALTDTQQAELYETTKATNAAVGRMETAVRDSTSGLQVQMDRLIKAVEELGKK